MAKQPVFVFLECTLKVPDFYSAFQILHESLESSDVAQIVTWSVLGNPTGTANVHVIRDLIQQVDNEPIKTVEAQLSLGVAANLWYSDQHRGWRIRISYPTLDVSKSRFSAFVQHMVDIGAFLLRKSSLLYCHATRKESDLSCIPWVPIAEAFPLVVTSAADVSRHYTDTRAFWDAGWHRVASEGDQVLLVRGTETLATADYLSEILEHQWAMARAAKPHLTKYFKASPSAEIARIFSAGDRYINPVAYLPDSRLAEYSCWIPDGQHIHGWEILEVYNLLQQHQLADGRPVAQVRIVFFDQEMAEKEKRPLLDIGARVFFQCADDIVEICE